jgi:hydrogenase expression/formation protein HypE
MTSSLPSLQGAICPVPLPHREQILIGHGSGGKLSHDLISRLFLPPFDNPSLNAGDDSGVVTLDGFRLAISTDSHVVWPLFFPGGDIGRLAVCGTVNDVAMVGASPLFMTAGFILEEGLEVTVLERIVASMQTAAQEAGITIIEGDTKVVQKNKADGLYINTTGIGVIPSEVLISGASAKPGDLILLSGSIGDHGIAVLDARGDLGFSSNVESDIAPLNQLVQSMLRASTEIHAMRDPTRGGLATTLNEIASQSQVGVHIQEDRIPIRSSVAAACEMLGFDPLHIANEGKLVAFVAPQSAEKVLEAMRRDQYGKDAAIIGEVRSDPPARVLLHTPLGSTRLVDIPSGEILPRIC